MAQAEHESLVALECLLDEFFAHTTSNRRKFEIEEQLGTFSSRRDCWRTCLYFLAHSSNHYVLMYALSAIESTISRLWVGLEWEHRVQLKSALYGYYVEQSGSSPHFLRAKLAKLIVDIAHFDWPHFYPEFFDNILQLLQMRDRQLLGLVLLRTTSEEFSNPHRTVTSQRHDELAKLLQCNVPRVFQILLLVLENLRERRQRRRAGATTATPPPSPTHHQDGGTDIELNHRELVAVASYRSDMGEVTREALLSIQHLFTWVPLQQVPESLIEALFRFSDASTYAQDDDETSGMAMSALNEILYRKCMPRGTEGLLLKYYGETVQLLKEVVSKSTDSIGNEFVGKLCEMMVLFVEQHLWKLKTNIPDFSPFEFLSLLYQLTVSVPSLQNYLRCLSVWSAFIKQLKGQEDLDKYGSVLAEIIRLVLTKLSFAHNHLQLEGLDELIVEENESEWGIFLKKSTEIIALAGEHIPLEAFNQTLLLWNSTNDFYCSELRMIENCNGKNRYESIEMATNLQHNLKDLSSLTQVLARLSDLFTDEYTEQHKISSPLIDRLLTILLDGAYLATVKSCIYKSSEYLAYLSEFADVHSQFLAALKTWSAWLPLNDDISEIRLRQLLAVTLPILNGSSVPNCDVTDPKFEHVSKIYCAAAHLFLSLTSAVTPLTLMLQPGVVDFVRATSTLIYSIRVKEMINAALCNVLLRPWGDLSETDAAQRNTLIEAFFDALTHDFRRLTAHSSEEEIHTVTKCTLHQLANIVDFASNFSSHSKKLLYSSLKPSIDFALDIFSNYSKYPDVSDCVLVLYLNVMNSLRQQFGVDSTRKTIQVFLDIAVQNQLSMNSCGLDKLLQILQIVVESPGASYKSLLPDILQLCLEQVYPFVIRRANEEPDIFIALLQLLKSILVHRWQYFYVSQIRLGHSPGCSELEPLPDNLRQPAQLLAVLHVFGQALLQLDINIFRASLSAIEELNIRWKLYHKTLFRQQVLSSFLTVLINTLLDRAHALLNEDVVQAIYNMATVEFDAFFDTFLPDFLQNCATTRLMPEQCSSLRQILKRDMDMPTFVQNFQRFINDLRCYKNSNANLLPRNIANN